MPPDNPVAVEAANTADQWFTAGVTVSVLWTCFVILILYLRKRIQMVGDRRLFFTLLPVHEASDSTSANTVDRSI